MCSSVLTARLETWGDWVWRWSHEEQARARTLGTVYSLYSGFHIKLQGLNVVMDNAYTHTRTHTCTIKRPRNQDTNVESPGHVFDMWRTQNKYNDSEKPPAQNQKLDYTKKCFLKWKERDTSIQWFRTSYCLQKLWLDLSELRKSILI